jgi:prepilin-type processing-associated H-X9-DG protein
MIAGAPFTTPEASYGWADAIFPYVKTASLYQCPSEKQNSSGVPKVLPTERGYTDYWFNSNLNGFSIGMAMGIPQIDAKTQSRIIVMGDGNDGKDLTDARYNLPALPATWINDKTSPLYRHLENATYAFLDGHVKMLKPEQISNGSAKESQYTFSPK